MSRDGFLRILIRTMVFGLGISGASIRSLMIDKRYTLMFYKTSVS